MNKIINKEKYNFSINQIFNVVFYLIIFFYLTILISLINPMRHVDPDFFQFLRDSEYYLRFQLPPSIQSLPANPILIGIFSKLLANFYTEIEVAFLINAIAMSTTIFLTHYVLKKTTNPWFAGLTTLFLISNPIVFDSASSNNSEVLFSMFMLIIFFLIWKKRENLVSVLTALGIVIRYESILLFLSFAIIDWIKNRNWKKSLRKVFLFLTLALPIMLIILSRNNSNSVLSNPFIAEVLQRKEDIPELRFISNIPFAFFYNKNYLLNKATLLSSLISVFFYLIIFLFIKKSSNSGERLTKTSLIFSILWLLFHALFPAYLERYFVPVIFSFIISITILINKQHHLVKKLFIIFLLIISLINFWKIAPNFKIDNKYLIYSSDYFTAQSILAKTQNDQKYTLLSPYPETLTYYYKNSQNISLISVNKIKEITDLDSLVDSITEYEKETNQIILIPYNNLLDWGIFGDYDNSLRKWYKSIGLYELGNFIYSDSSCLWHEEKWPDYAKDNFINIKLYVTCFVK